MITYNHEKFIAQALDSVLMQQVDFDYEIVIGDDLSQDRTREILLEYRSKHPDKIRLLLYEEKQGVGGNIYHVLTNCNGTYIALLEGDDYWTSVNKLQVQVNFLQTQPEFSLCFHSVEIWNESENRFSGFWRQAQEGIKYRLADLLINTIFPHFCSVVFDKRRLVLPDWYKSITQGDIVLWMLNAEHGYLGYINKAMSEHRVHNQGVWSGASALTQLQQYVEVLERLNEHFQYKYKKYLKVNLTYCSLAVKNRELGEKEKSREYFLKAITNRNGENLSVLRIVKTGTGVYLHRVYVILLSIKSKKLVAFF